MLKSLCKSKISVKYCLYAYDVMDIFVRVMVKSRLSNNSLLRPLKYEGMQNLIQRNEKLYSSGDPPSGGVALPFILVQVNMII